MHYNITSRVVRPCITHNIIYIDTYIKGNALSHECLENISEDNFTIGTPMRPCKRFVKNKK